MIKAGWMTNYIRMDLLDWIKAEVNVFYEKEAWGTSYNGPLGEVPPERDTFLKHQVYAVKIRFFLRGGGLCSQANAVGEAPGIWKQEPGISH